MEEKRIEVTVKVGDTRITLEGPEDFVRREVERFAGIVAVPQGAPSQTNLETQNGSEKELVQAKEPQGHAEIVAVLAYCLSQRGQEEFTDDDIRRAYLRANLRPPKVIGQAIRDAKNKFDFIITGGKRGTYRLSPHGERTVIFDLPRKKGS